MMVPPTQRGTLKSSCSHCPATFVLADQACAESMVEREEPVPVLSLFHTELYTRLASGVLAIVQGAARDGKYVSQQGYCV